MNFGCYQVQWAHHEDMAKTEMQDQRRNGCKDKQVQNKIGKPNLIIAAHRYQESQKNSRISMTDSLRNKQDLFTICEKKEEEELK